MGRLNYINIDTKKVVVVTESNSWEVRDYNWSPDSRWIAYTLPQTFGVNQIYIYDTQSGDSKPVTDSWYDAGQPTFDSNGKYLFFTSARDFNPIYSNTEWNHAYRDMSRIYFVTLEKSTPSPFEPENDEVTIEKQEKSDSKKDDKDKGDAKADEFAVKIDFDGIVNRIVKLPVKAGNYFQLTAIDNSIYYNQFISGSDGSNLFIYDLKSQTETELGEVSSYIISANNKKMFVSIKGKYAVIDLPKGKIKPTDYLDLTNMKVMVNLKEEWAQIYNESWRQMRDFFYAPNMHGVDWPSIKEKYSVLLPYVSNRNDLNYIIGEMIGELSVGHSYVLGGDKPKPNRIKTGYLALRSAKDKIGATL